MYCLQAVAKQFGTMLREITAAYQGVGLSVWTRRKGEGHKQNLETVGGSLRLAELEAHTRKLKVRIATAFLVDHADSSLGFQTD